MLVLIISMICLPVAVLLRIRCSLMVGLSIILLMILTDRHCDCFMMA